MPYDSPPWHPHPRANEPDWDHDMCRHGTAPSPCIAYEHYVVPCVNRATLGLCALVAALVLWVAHCPLRRWESDHPTRRQRRRPKEARRCGPRQPRTFDPRARRVRRLMAAVARKKGSVEAERAATWGGNLWPSLPWPSGFAGLTRVKIERAHVPSCQGPTSHSPCSCPSDVTDQRTGSRAPSDAPRTRRRGGPPPRKRFGFLWTMLMVLAMAGKAWASSPCQGSNAGDPLHRQTSHWNMLDRSRHSMPLWGQHAQGGLARQDPSTHPRAARSTRRRTPLPSSRRTSTRWRPGLAR